MARNHNFYFNEQGSPCARGPYSEKTLMAFLENDVQGDDHICHDIMEDITAIEDESAESREFIGNAHIVTLTKDGVVIETQHTDPTETYKTVLKHFREILEDWEAFILADDDADDYGAEYSDDSPYA